MRSSSDTWLRILSYGGATLAICWLIGAPEHVLANNDFCIEKPCFFRATAKPLPHGRSARKGIEFAMGKMRFNIPGKLKKVSMPTKGLLTIKLADGGGMTVRLVDNEDLLSLLPAAARAHKVTLAAAKIPQIIFEKTPEDVEPTEANDKSIWRSMIMRKKFLFSNTSHLARFDMAKFNTYVAEGVDGPFAMLALKEGGAYVEIQARHYPLHEFEKIITGVETN